MAKDAIDVCELLSPRGVESSGLHDRYGVAHGGNRQPRLIGMNESMKPTHFVKEPTQVRDLLRMKTLHSSKQIVNIIQTGRNLGMIDMDQAIMDHVKAGRVTHEDAYEKAINKDKVRKLLDEEKLRYPEGRPQVKKKAKPAPAPQSEEEGLRGAAEEALDELEFMEETLDMPWYELDADMDLDDYLDE